MEITVKLFASLREAAGTGELQLALASGARIANAIEQIRDQYPALTQRLAATRYALNREYAQADCELHQGDQLALIPPVAGGS